MRVIDIRMPSTPALRVAPRSATETFTDVVVGGAPSAGATATGSAPARFKVGCDGDFGFASNRFSDCPPAEFEIPGFRLISALDAEGHETFGAFQARAAASGRDARSVTAGLTGTGLGCLTEGRLGLDGDKATADWVGSKVVSAATAAEAAIQRMLLRLTLHPLA
ncbi:hypothetical protein AB0K09_16510 [Streptomyces sp. NPDC049577]|uniref:hypothetical protein n=1 Tax=Streptomyces sp. NPDC049577 TaxID=3155153 RepID=UPI003435E405